MMGLLACQSCGVVAREDSFDGESRGCAECGRAMEPISLLRARALALARRRAERRRVEAQAVSEVGLGGTHEGISEGEEYLHPPGPV